MLYVYVGSESIVGESRLTFGRKIELTEEKAKEAILGHVPLVPMLESGFSADELKRFASPFAREAAPDDFKSKHKAAIGKFQEVLGLLKAGGSLPKPPAPAAPVPAAPVSPAKPSVMPVAPAEVTHA